MKWQQMTSDELAYYFKEDGIEERPYYFSKLPGDQVNCQLKFKSPMTIAGLPYFNQCFEYLGATALSENIISEMEGKAIPPMELNFKLPFSVALTGERLALNLLQHASAIATYTSEFVKGAQKYGIKILDTRKTLPGLRSIEKYAVRIGGGYNHRQNQTDVWMIKDNHKKFFGGIKEAMDFFKSQQSFYTPIVVEIHSVEELEQAINLGINHVMLDNFTPHMITEAIALKKNNMTYEVSGGVNLENIGSFLVAGIDAISIGRLTYGAPPVDISLKYSR